MQWLSVGKCTVSCTPHGTHRALPSTQECPLCPLSHLQPQDNHCSDLPHHPVALSVHNLTQGPQTVWARVT